MPRAVGARDRRRPEAGDAMRRQERAYGLWMGGMTFQQIADSPDPGRAGAPLYGNKGSAHRAVERSRERHSGFDNVEAERDLHRRRYEALFRSVYPKALGGDLWAHDRALRILQAKEELLGMKAPTRAQIEVLTVDTVDDAIRELTAKIARDEAALAADVDGQGVIGP